MSESADSPQIVLADSVARNVGIVLSMPSAGLVRHFQTRFLGEIEEGIWIEAVSDCLDLVRESLEAKRPVAVSFKSSTRRYSFAVPIHRLDLEYRINAETIVAALLISKPKEIRGIQRRIAYRVRIRPDDEMTVRIWSISEHAHLQDRPMAAQEIKCEARDISIGGLGIWLRPKEGESIRLVQDQRLRVQVRFREEELLLDGRLRNGAAKTITKDSPIGIVFKKLETDMDGRKNLAVLTRIVGELQRDEVRRMRLGIAS